MSKRILSMLLVICMALTLLPATAFAAEGNAGISPVVDSVITYQNLITFDANGGTVSPTATTTNKDSMLASLPAPTRNGYRFDGWFTEKSGGTQVKTNTVLTKDTVIYAHWTATSGGSYSGGSSGTTPIYPSTSANVDGKGEIISSKVTAETTNAIAQAKKAGKGTRANIVATNPTYVTPKTLQDMAAAAAKAGGTAWLFADSAANGNVMVRIYINAANAQSSKEKILLAGEVSGRSVEATQNKFVNFDNKMAVVSMAQQKAFPTSTEIAAKVDLTGLNTKTLHFYSYDKASDLYYPITAPSYCIDKSGYLHFTTTRAGDIVITDKPLALKK